MHIHSESSRAPPVSLFSRQDQAGGFRPFQDPDAQPLHFLRQGGLEGGAPDPDSKFVLIIIGKHQLALLIPEPGPCKFIFRIPDLPAEYLQIQKPVISFPALDIMGDPIAVPVLLPDISPGDLLRSDTGAGIGAGRFPMVKTGSGGSAFLHRPLFHQGHRLPLPGRRNGRKAAGQAAAQDQHVAVDGLLLVHFILIRPFIFYFTHSNSPESQKFILIKPLFCAFTASAAARI